MSSSETTSATTSGPASGLTPAPPPTEDLVGRAGDVLERLQAAAGNGGYDAQVRATRIRHGLTRFANSFVHQHVDEDVTALDVRMARDGHAVGATTTDLSPEGIATFVETLRATAASAPEDPGWAGFAPPDDAGSTGTAMPEERFDEATAVNDPGERAELVATFVRAAGDLAAAGYCDTEATEVGYVNSAGRSQLGRVTRATVDGIHQTDTSAGAGHQTSMAIGELDARAAGEQARRRAEDGRDGGDVEPGHFEVVLGPEAVATILVFLGFYGFNAKAHLEEQSPIQLSEPQFDAAVTIRDAIEDPRALRLPFDAEGTPRRATTLVEGGTAVHFVHDRRTAAVTGTRSTGHAVDGGSTWGAFPSTITLDPGSSTPEQLIGSVERGLYVASFNYCRVLDPKTLVVTGLTRNGTFLVNDGEVSRPLQNLRFTQSFTQALGPGNVKGIGDDDRYADAEFGAGFSIAPSIHLGDFHITGNANG